MLCLWWCPSRLPQRGRTKFGTSVYDNCSKDLLERQLYRAVNIASRTVSKLLEQTSYVKYIYYTCTIYVYGGSGLIRLFTGTLANSTERYPGSVYAHCPLCCFVNMKSLLEVWRKGWTLKFYIKMLLIVCCVPPSVLQLRPSARKQYDTRYETNLPTLCYCLQNLCSGALFVRIAINATCDALKKSL